MDLKKLIIDLCNQSCKISIGPVDEVIQNLRNDINSLDRHFRDDPKYQVFMLQTFLKSQQKLVQENEKQKNYRHSSNSDLDVSIKLVLQKFIQFEIDLLTPQNNFLKYRISTNRVKSIINRYPLDTYDYMTSYITTQKITYFPWKCNSISEQDVKDMFSRIRNFKPKISNSRYWPAGVKMKTNKKVNKSRKRKRFGDEKDQTQDSDVFLPIEFQPHNDQFISVISSDDDYKNMDIITDYFTEEQRMKARRKNRISPWSRFVFDDQFRKSCIQTCIRDFEFLSLENIREIIFQKTSECTQFKVSASKAIIEMLLSLSLSLDSTLNSNSGRVLDISAGWGDRLISCIASEKVSRYISFDPNTDLKSGHDKIMTLFINDNKKTQTQYKIIYEGFLESTFLSNNGNNTFDLVFTSPPFFDLEIYETKTRKQSIDVVKNNSINPKVLFEAWVTQFLFPCLSKAWSHLVIGGYMAIHMSDMRGHQICEPMCLFIISKCPGATYQGTIGITGSVSKKTRPVWIFKKMSEDLDLDSNLKIKKQEATELLTKLYPKLLLFEK